MTVMHRVCVKQSKLVLKAKALIVVSSLPLRDINQPLEGVYPQSDVSLVIGDIDASKGFVDLWVHFFLGTECINRNGYRCKVLFWGFN